MNRMVFGIKNVYDKITKIFNNPSLSIFYLNTFVLSRFSMVKPDIYIVSYPKCGRTWVRVALRKYLELSGYPDAFRKEANSGTLPGGKLLRFDHDISTWVPAPLRIDQLHFDSAKYKGKRVCFIVRNPCDVLVSSWYHLKYREKIYSRDLKEFVRDDTLGIHKVIAFMNMWVDNMNVPDEFQLLTYEDLRRDPESQFRALFTFIGLDINPELLTSSIKDTSFEKMKQIERRGELSEPWLRAGDQKSDKSMKVRRGKVGGYKEDLSSDDIRFLHDTINTYLSDRLPYRFDVK